MRKMIVGNVIDLRKGDDPDDFPVDYIVHPKDGVIGTAHPDWPFIIQRDVDTNETAIIHNETGDAFGVLPTDVFNTIILCHLLATDSKLMIDAAENLLDDKEYCSQ